MAMAVTFLTILSRFPYIISALRACVPNTEFTINGKICYCNNLGQWSEASCHSMERRRQICTPGKIIWKGCSQCICQENGQLSCVEDGCNQDLSVSNQYSNMVNAWCTPFRSYYIDCSLCICPASGRISEAHCARDTYCSIQEQPSFSDLVKNKQGCIPKVMYLFSCLHCLCSDDGFFVRNKCVETCQKPSRTEIGQKCMPNSFYRKECNVCHCPENGIIDEKLCTTSVCSQESYSGYLRTLKSKSVKCIPHSFLKPRCVYCDCTSKGTINDNSCLELNCLESYKYDVMKHTCRQGEAVACCMECLCLRNGKTNINYCSKSCTYEGKIAVLEDVIRDSAQNDLLIDKVIIKKDLVSERCEPSSVYSDQGRYCICPENGITNFNLCTLNKEVKQSKLRKKINDKINIDFNITCEPNTFVEFDCNTCFCSKKGKIDPKWCTYDDCDAKRTILQSHDAGNDNTTPKPEINEHCHPGSISKVECNFCICPDRGSAKDKVCTKNDCTAFALPSNSNDKFVCDPLAYYEVDCNVCLCPKDGLKNVAKCTKNHCEKSFLRSDVCVAGQLFSDECNVCVCPPNGNKSERACTNYTCFDTAPWKKIFQLSESLLGNQVAEDATRNLELCFPGEEFAVGCKLCVCPDMGLRDYAVCSPMLCEDEAGEKPHLQDDRSVNSNNLRSRATVKKEDCVNFNTTYNLEKKNCSPGRIYVIGCRECICPSFGDTNQYCRNIPEPYCSRFGSHSNMSSKGVKTADSIKGIIHEHTQHSCLIPGKIMNECFVCECLELSSVIIEEHCFKSDAENCLEASPIF